MELLFEIGTEELPPSYVRPALEDLASGVRASLESARIGFSDIRTIGTPRRLVLIIRGLAEKAEDSRETVFGPPASTAFDEAGKPTKAALGFAKAQGVDVAELKTAAKDKGEYVCIEKVQEGAQTVDNLGRILRAELGEGGAGIRFPKTMRWEKEGRRFARPIRWMALVIDGKPAADSRGEPFSWAGIEAGNVTEGHRFLGSREIKIRSVGQYIEDLRRNFVIADHEERKRLISERIREAVAAVGGSVVDDDELLERVTFTVEHPLAIAGSFSPAFLEMPSQVVVTALREHQDFFSVCDGDGNLMPHFIAVANMDRDRTGKIKEGNERVLKARLEDAHFYWQQDLSDGLEAMADRLTEVVWQEQLGTLREKSERLAGLAVKLAQRTGLSDESKVRRAAHLCKADLTSLMVREKEFSSLQGLMGEEYAKALGEEVEVARAIFEHYLPRFAGDELPSTAEGTILALADKLDTLAGCFGVGMSPTGSQDPYGLRRQATGLVRILYEGRIDLPLRDWVDFSIRLLGQKLTEDPVETGRKVLEFVEQRIETLLVDEGYRPDLVASVLHAGVESPAQMRKKLEAIKEFETDERFGVLITAFKRAFNITLGHEGGEIWEDLLIEPAEVALYTVYRDIEPRFAGLAEREEYREVLELMLELSDPIDVFFDKVMVMADDQRLKQNRLNLLAKITHLFAEIADFSKLEVG